MRIAKVINNNVVQALNQDKEELIVMGKGLGFQKKVGDEVDPSKIEKTFYLQAGNKDKAAELSRVYVGLDSREIELVLAIIARAEEVLHLHFDLSLYIALADHLHYTLERTAEGLTLKNPLAWEVRKFYPQEYQVGIEALDLVQKRLGRELPKDEAASIALHIVNAEKDGGLQEKNLQTTKIVTDILGIVRLHLGRELEEDSISYNRFVTHIQYFAQRVVNGLIQGENDAFLYEQVAQNYPQSFACTQNIKTYVTNHHSFEMSPDEQVYLTIHIQRLRTNL